MNRYGVRGLVQEITMIAVALVFAFPLYVLVNLAFRGSHDTSSSLLPTTRPTFANFIEAWQEASLGPAAVNSLFVTVTSVVVIVAVSAFAAYPLARVTSRWSTLTFAFLMLGLLLPFQLALIPLYRTMRDLQLLGTPWALILFYSGLQVPLSTFLYTGFLRSLPREYEEAAHMDGCGTVQAFVRVVFPLMRPITGTVVILNVVFVWNDFLTPLMYLSGSDRLTIPVAIFGFVGQYSTQWNLVFAGLVIALLPVLIAYFLMQRSIIRGFAAGLKG